jgi:3-oxoacyl-[acyl-carrier-protein] synthase-3
MGTSIGIQGLGVYLPPEVRRNDWWTPETIARWKSDRPPGPPPEPRTDGERRVLRAMQAQALDPFRGAVERHVMPAEMSLLDMEERAARTALARAGIAPGEIDLLLTNTVVPEFLLGNPATSLHQRLGLPRACFSMHTDVVSHTFMMQLHLAEAMIGAGHARCALIVQSCAPSRLLEADGPMAPFFGDVATAAVVGRTASGRGIEAAVHVTDGRFPRYLIASVPNLRWYDEGRAMIHIADPGQTQQVLLELADAYEQAVDAALAKASWTRADVDFFCIHQGAPWVGAVMREHLGLSAARSLDTFARTGYVFASSQPIGLALAEEQGLLREGDRVLLLGGGPGITYGVTVLRWGA